MKEKIKTYIGKMVPVILFAGILVFLGLVLKTKLLPAAYLLPIGLVLLLLILLIYVLVRKPEQKIRFLAGMLLAVLFAGILVWAGAYINRGWAALDNISGVTTEIAQIGVYVKADHAAESVNDLKNGTYGILKDLDRENTDTVIQHLNEELETELSMETYAGITELVDGLLGGETDAVILNQAYLDVLEEIPGYEDTASNIREISLRQVETVLAVKQPVQEKERKKVYTMFISGIDTRGKITAKSRSDVNILVVANVDTRQILLVSTPRDFFVPLSISGGVPDKLTHAGIYGVQVSMDTLGMLYDMDVDYYFRLNFGGFVDIIDALGGVTVDSEKAFRGSGYEFHKGKNTLDGKAALAFARERHAFGEGDRQRGRNQMAVITGVIEKALSPQLLENFSSVLKGVEGSFETNVPYDEIAYLVRKQLSEGGDWKVRTFSVNGTGASKKPYSMSQRAYVMIPDQTTVEEAKALMRQVRDGEILTEQEKEE